jgi:hypothetical protein
MDILVDAVKSKTRKKDIVEFQQTIINQMSKAEDYNIQIKSIMTSSYANLMLERDPKCEARQHRDYKFYQVLVSSILDELKRNTLKDSIKSVDVTTLSQSDFDAFVEQKSDVIITLMIDYLDLMYNNTGVVSRDDLHKLNLSISKDIKEIFRKMYHSIKSIIVEDKKYIQEIDNDLVSDVHHIKSQLQTNCPMNKIKSILDETNKEEK